MSFPDDGVAWLRWEPEVEADLVEKGAPILLFIADPMDPLLSLHAAIFRAIPKNARLRKLLHEQFSALYIEMSDVREEERAMGAGDRYHIAIVSPYGFNPLVTFDPTRGKPDEIVAEIAHVLEAIARA